MRPLHPETAGLRDALAGEAISDEAQIAAINDCFRHQLDGLRRRFQAWEIPAIVRALRLDRDLSLRLLRERRAQEQFFERQERKRRMLPGPPQP